MGLVLNRKYIEGGFLLAIALLAVMPVLPDWNLCPVRLASGGICCPTCGATHAVWHLVHGRFAEAWQANPVSFVVMIVAARIGFGLVARQRFDGKYIDLTLLTLFLLLGTYRFLQQF